MENNFEEILSLLGNNQKLSFYFIKMYLFSNTKLYIKNLENMCKNTNESMMINSIVWKYFIDEKQLFCIKDFKSIKSFKNSEINVYDILLNLIKAIIYLFSVNFKSKS